MAQQKKYEFTEEFKYLTRYVKLKRIRAIMDIPEHGVKAGDVGGWIQKVGNLSRFGTCWVKDDAVVYGNAKVLDSSLIEGNAQVFGSSEIHGSSQISGDADISDKTIVKNSQIGGKAVVCGDVSIQDSIIMDDVSIVAKFSKKINVENSKILERVSLLDGVSVCNSSIDGIEVRISNNARIEKSHITGKDLFISNNVVIKNSQIDGTMVDNQDIFHILDDAIIEDSQIIAEGTVQIENYARMSDGIYLQGSNIFIKDRATVKGFLVIFSDTTIKDFASILFDTSNTSERPVSEVRNLLLENDDVYLV